MKTIILFCANGFSTIMMRDKIRETSRNEGLNYTIEAFPFAKLEEEGQRADLILLAPQIRFNRKEIFKVQSFCEDVICTFRETVGDGLLDQWIVGGYPCRVDFINESLWITLSERGTCRWQHERQNCDSDIFCFHLQIIMIH